MGKCTSRYKNYWYNIVLKMIKRYPTLLEEEDSIQSWNFKHAIDRAINELQHDHPKDFTDRMRALNMMYFNGNCKSFTATAMSLYVGEATVKRWASDFVERVGKQAGFKSKY